jgi:predicted  nucleic acid-binding Zn-ribbon protein
MSKEETDLATHVEICALRYQGIQDKIEKVENKLSSLDNELREFKEATTVNLNEIKDLIGKRMSQSYQNIIASAGTVIVALIGFLGYLLTHIK